jgi:UDP-2,3-diacylglucosamine hydrolase
VNHTPSSLFILCGHRAEKPMPIHLISDLHLSEDTPDLSQLFSESLLSWSGKIDALYILGDLFEYWIGDDDDSPFIQSIQNIMLQFSSRTSLFVMHGNRDFLLGSAFARRSGATLISDPTELVHAGQRYLLSHGDALCSDDLVYQQFRSQSRNPAWQQAMLARPLAERRAIARQARLSSQASKQANGLNAISDVTDTAVHALLDEHHWPVLIHGHTHRPAVHRLSLKDKTSQRWVIADWHDGHGAYLRLDQEGLSAHSL